MSHAILLFCALNLFGGPPADGVRHTYAPSDLLQEALQALNASDQSDEESQDAMREKIASLQLRIGAINDAIATMANLHDTEIRDSLRVHLIRHYARHRQRDRMIQLIRSMPVQAGNLNNYRMLAIDEAVAEYLTRLQFSEAVTLIDDFLPSNQQNESLTIVARQCIRVGEYAYAENLIGRLPTTQQVKLLCGLARAKMANGQHEEARAVMERVRRMAEQVRGDEKDVALSSLSVTYAEMKMHIAAADVLKEIASPKQRFFCMFSTAQTYARDGESGRVLDLCRQIHTDYPNEPTFGFVEALAESGFVSEACRCAIRYAPSEDLQDTYVIQGVIGPQVDAGNCRVAFNCLPLIRDADSRLFTAIRILKACRPATRAVADNWQTGAIEQAELQVLRIQPILARANAYVRLAEVHYAYRLPSRAEKSIASAVRLISEIEPDNEPVNYWWFPVNSLSPVDSLRTSIASAWLAGNQFDKAIEIIESLQEKNEIQRLKIRLLLDAGEYVRAYAVVSPEDRFTGRSQISYWLKHSLEVAAQSGSIAWAAQQARKIKDPWHRAEVLHAVATGTAAWQKQNSDDGLQNVHGSF